MQRRAERNEKVVIVKLSRIDLGLSPQGNQRSIRTHHRLLRRIGLYDDSHA